MERGLFDIADRGQVSDMLATFSACVNLSARLIDTGGRVLEACGGEMRYCRLVKARLFEPGACETQYVKAAELAHKLGEAYVFACHAGLNHIAFPLAGGGSLYGAVLAGPFLMDEPDSSILIEMGERRALDNRLALDLYDELGALPVVPPERVRHIADLMAYVFSPLIPDAKREMMRNRRMLTQQSRIGETIQTFKAANAAASPEKHFLMEQELLSKVKSGDTQEAKRMLNDLLGYVLFSEGRSIEMIRARAVELCALLSRVAIERGASTEGMLAVTQRFYETSSKADSIEEVCLSLSQLVETFMEGMFGPGEQSEEVRRAIRYIARHYALPLSLQDVADDVHLSPSYFSTLFHQKMGVSFRDYVNQVRVEEAKRRLLLGEDSIVEVALAVGFSDQSYFSKVFRKLTGVTPKKWRDERGGAG